MSIFHPVNLNCPHCGEAVDFAASASVNADRRPDLRDAILDGSFQRAPCPHCSLSFRVDPQLNYLDVGRGQWIAAFPGAWIDQWPALEATATEAFAKSFGLEASAAAREIGDTLTPRMVFGWEGLREKLVAADAGLDDVGLELTKMALMRGVTDPPLPFGQQLRLVEVDAEPSPAQGPGESSLVLLLVPDATPAPGSAEPPEELRVPRALYDDILAEPQDWQALRTQVSAGLFTDVLRLTRGAD